MNKEVSFELAKMLKENGFNEHTLYFYTKPNSKMFGIDEHSRHYPIKNTSGKLYTSGEHAALNIENVYFAPTIAEVVMWLYEKHEIWIVIEPVTNKIFRYIIYTPNTYTIKNINTAEGNSPTEAYEKAIKYILTNVL